MKAVTEKLSEIIHCRAVNADLKLPLLAKPLRLQRKLKPAGVMPIRVLVGLAITRPRHGQTHATNQSK